MIFVLGYVVVLVLTRTLVDAQTRADGRILMPVWIAGIVAAPPLLLAATDRLRRRELWWICLGLALLMAIVNGQQMLVRADRWRERGSGYGSKAWRRSAAVAATAQLAPELSIYSNGADALRFLGQREALSIPRQLNPNSRQPYPDYNQRMETMCTACRAGEAVIVYLYEVDWRDYLPNREAVVTACELVVLQELEDGLIYGAPMTEISP